MATFFNLQYFASSADCGSIHFPGYLLVLDREKALLMIWNSQSSEHCELVDRIRSGDQAAEADLYRKVLEFGRAPLWHLLGPAAEDLLHDVYLETLSAIRGPELREGSRLKPFILTIAMRLAWIQVYRAKRFTEVECLATDPRVAREDPTFESILLDERVGLVKRALAKLRPTEREVLERFYLNGDDPQTIRETMGLSETQYRLLKSRAKKKCAERVGLRSRALAA